ncbi:hypothetical protein DIPPA_18064 [Diplonema papillatum]|nr:hypothetical protein DIPPA_18064 [Diplonema papillatum]
MSKLQKVALYGCSTCANCWTMSFALRWQGVDYTWRDINQPLHGDWVQKRLAETNAPVTEVNLPVLMKGDKMWYNIGGPTKHLNVAKEIKNA